MVCFIAIPRDGIFEIYLSNSYTSESPIYAVSNKRAKLDLDSALLWHRRLGHISKKCIEKLQHDGLLDSTDLRHKHEVFETFKVFQKEVENQLGKTIKSLRSDCGGEYMSQEFLDHLKDHGIIAHRTPPYTPQHNGVSERRNRTLLDMQVALQEKTNMDRVVHTYKARLVAKGYTQTPRIDYEETFSPVADIRAISILIAIAAYYDYDIWKMDVKTSFFNGYINEEVYMEQPKGFVNPKYPNRVCKLKRFNYGLKQASRQWNKRFDDEIKKFGFTQNHDEPCVYLKASGSDITFLILYVNDILIMGNNIPMLQSVKSYLGRCFAMKDLGEAAYILGIKIYKDRSRRLIGLCQSAYIGKILKRYCMENSKRGSIPMQEKLKLSKSQVAKYIAAFDASKEAVWVRKFISGLGVVPTIEEPISMYCDNTGAIAIANESGITKGSRHFHAKVHYLREVIEYGDVKLEKFTQMTT
nr:retrotransposon protein, putative, Ty1-copia subclass [Tanacetum cinerariifolium]